MTTTTKTIDQLINETRGRIFQVTFAKKDGSVRRMVARTGVRKGVTGEGLKFNPSERSLRTVWDITKGAHRFVNLKTVTAFRCGKLSLS